MVKLQIPAGKATPAPPVGPALGQHGVNIMDFCKAFNAKTSAKDQEGLIIPVVITVYHDRTFTFITKTPPASVLLKRAAGIAKGSGEPNKNKVGKVTEKQVEEIAKLKMPDLNARDLAAAVATVKGTARSMGIEVVRRRLISLGRQSSAGCSAGPNFEFERSRRNAESRKEIPDVRQVGGQTGLHPGGCHAGRQEGGVCQVR